MSIEQIYLKFLQSNGCLYSAVELSKVTEKVSHDQVTYFLAEASYCAANLWQTVKKQITLNKGILIADDVVIPKPRSKKIAGCGWHYCSAQGKLVWGLNLVVLVWSNSHLNIPIDYCLYQRGETSKNVLLRTMLKKAKRRGFAPQFAAFDSWYASIDNLHYIRKLGWIFVIRVKCNRQVSSVTLPYQRVDTLDWSNHTASQLFIKGFGKAKICQASFPNTGNTVYLMTNALTWPALRITKAYRRRWPIEELFRLAKQALGLAGCQARKLTSQLNHFYFVFVSLAEMEKRRVELGISGYEQRAEILRVCAINY